jgi:hypothetical protein
VTGLGNIFTKAFGIACLALLAVACAKQIAPTGGDKDVTPPKILSSYPLNESVDFHENEIVLEFDEYVVTQSLINELVISPPLEKDPEVKMKGKKVVITWEDTLAGNTTYMFQMGEGIKDLNEGNPLDSNIFVFSTGSYIDSFSQSGKVINAFTLKPVEDALVMLYRANIDSLPKTRNPDYFAKTDADGLYKIQYLAKGDYKAFVLLPTNKGYKYDLPRESIAFSDTLVTALYVPKPRIIKDTNALDSLAQDSVSIAVDTSKVDSAKIKRPLKQVETVFNLFVQQDTAQYLKGSGQLTNRGIYLSFNKPVKELVVNALDATDVSVWKENWAPESDSVVYWFEEIKEYDSLKLEVIMDGAADTVFFRKYVAKIGKGKKQKGDKGFTLSKNFSNKLFPNQSLELISETPIALLKTDSIMLYAANDTIAFGEYLTRNNFSLIVNYTFVPDVNYDIYFPKGSVEDLYGQAIDSSRIKFSMYKEEEMGVLTINYTLPAQMLYIWQLLDSKGNVVDAQQVNAKGTVVHTNLEAGSYQIQIIFDANGNGVWDAGIYDLKQQPERILFYDQPIDVRANWTNEIDWLVED